MSPDTERRIRDVTEHLLPLTAFDGRFGPPRPLAERMDRLHTPGVSVAVIDRGRLDWARGFGLREAGRPEKVTADTLFQAASISKPIFALAVLRLVEAGRLDLDQDVNEVLKSWRVPDNEGWQPRVTLRQILSHTAGLTVHGFAGYRHGETVPTLRQILDGEHPANSEKVEVNILPGLVERYSGGGTLLGQQVVMDLTGRPFPDVMRELVLDPLGMENSTFEQPLPAAWIARAAAAHPWKGVPLPSSHHVYPEMAPAGLWTTPTDLATAGVALTAILQGDGSGFLKRETVQMILSPHLPGLENPGGCYFGLGFMCCGKDETFYFEHTGWNEGFLSLLRVYPNTRQGLVVMLNSNEGRELLEEIARAVGHVYGWPAAPKPEPYALGDAGKYGGRYRLESGLEVTILERDSGIAVQVGDQPALPLRPISALEFAATAVNARVVFEREELGEPGDEWVVNALVLRQAGREFRATRQAGQ